LEKLQKAGVVRVGYANEVPYAYKEGEKVTGSSFELVRSFFAQYNLKVEGVPVEFSGLIPGLQANRFDVVGAGMFILPPRCKVASFGNPDYQGLTGFAVGTGNPLNIHSFKDLAASKAVYGTSAGVAEVEYAQVAGVPDSRIKRFPSYADAAAALAAGQVDVVGQQQIGLRATLKALNSPKVEYLDLSEPAVDKSGAKAVGYGSAAFKKGDSGLRDLYNSWLAKSRDEGLLEKIVSPFGFTKRDLPPTDVTADKLCAAS
jgi:polar amino acid transport system substrate-binding protein